MCPCLRADIDNPYESADQWLSAYAVLGVHDHTRVPQSAQGVLTVFESIVALVKLIPDVTLQGECGCIALHCAVLYCVVALDCVVLYCIA